jgi:hypothetical protein
MPTCSCLDITSWNKIKCVIDEVSSRHCILWIKSIKSHEMRFKYASASFLLLYVSGGLLRVVIWILSPPLVLGFRVWKRDHFGIFRWIIVIYPLFRLIIRVIIHMLGLH